MEFKDYLKICKTFFMSEMTVPEFMMNFFCDLASSEDVDDESEACPFQKETNYRKSSKVYYGERPMTRTDAYYMKTHFNEEALIEKINDLEEHVQQNLADELTDHGIDADIWNLSDVMCDLFRGYMDEMSRKMVHKSKKNDHSACTTPEEAHSSKKTKLIFDSKTMELARNFCIDHENEKRLFILCQIADYIDPLHQHVRSLYTEYLRQNDEVKNAIMVLNNIPLLQFEKDWEYDYLDVFRNDIRELKLVTEKDLLYEGGKYFHRARNYPKIVFRNVNPRIFPIVPRDMISKQIDKGDLLSYIDEYLYYKDNEKYFKYVNVPPFDWMIEHLNLLNCSEEELAYWMCLFIRSACLIIPREIPARQKPEKEYDEDADEDECFFLTPGLNDLETMEDLYYSTLYIFHDLYSGDLRE
ncbi:MAG: hypothetical protein IKX10_04225 [Lachnospiraceae bacterium]|nr:hypothetical protein [Lachnospiraceae bacterium]